jgi:CRP-like cAMP-binding protein
MNPAENRRRDARRTLETLEVCVLHFAEDSGRPEKAFPDRLFVDLLDRSQTGARVRSVQPIEPGTRLSLQAYDPVGKTWRFFPAEVKHIAQDPVRRSNHQIGLDFTGQAQACLRLPEKEREKTIPAATDYEFFRGIDLLKRLHRDAVCPVLNRLRLHRIPAGARLITQGDDGDAFYVIQRGSCSIHVEKNGEIHRVAGRQKGDILGEMALVTGEPRSAHVDAETDMDLWAISRQDFDQIAQEFPELRGFLTEIVADRFASSRVTAERKVGKYVITDIIGRGGYSIVYKGIHARLNMSVVVKMLNHDMAMDPRFIENFEKEARIIAQFNHENIVRVYDIEARFQTVFIVMEYLEGRSLRQVLQEMHWIPARKVVACLLQVCSGLHYAHERGIVHQDIKPGNIFILPGERVKILDFGLAAPCGTESTMTGTPFYMSPEQVECLPVDERSDIYSLGLLAFEMLAGRRPFPEDDPHKVMDLHVEQDIPDPEGLVDDLHPRLRTFILKACARDPEKRYRNIPEVIQDLRPLAEELALLDPQHPAERRKMATLVMIYNNEQQLMLKRLLEEFSDKAEKAGILLKAAEFGNI